MIPVAACFKFWEQHCESVPGYKSTFYLKLKGLLLIVSQVKAAVGDFYFFPGLCICQCYLELT